MRTLIGAGIITAMLVTVPGCSSTGDSVRKGEEESRGESALAIPDQVKEANRERALKHFIDGALHDSKGDYPKAILEYQDALRYDRDPAIYYALSKDYSIIGKHALAAQAAREAIRLDSTKISYRENLATIYLNASQRDEAIREYENILALDSNYAPAWYALGRLHLARRPLKALEIFERLLDREGESIELLLQLGQIYASMGKFEKSADCLERVLRLEPGNRMIQLQVAEMQHRAGKTEKAVKILESMIEVDDSDVEALATLADISMEQRDFAKATRLFERLLAIQKDNPEIMLRVGAAYFGQAERDSAMLLKAKKLFEEAAAGMPENWRPFWYLGAIAEMQGNDSLATTYFERVTSLEGETFDAWWVVATRAFDTNQHEKVLELMQRAKRLFPNDFRVYLLLGLSSSRLNQNEAAVENLQKSLELNPDDVNTLSSLALTLDGMKRFEESDSLYERALRIDPNSHIVLNNYGYSLAERDLQLARSLEMSLEAVKADSANSSYLDTLGWIYYKLGNYPEAARYIEKAIAAGDASAVVHEHLGDVYFRLNETAKALELWQKALDIDPANTDLKAKVRRGSL
ncbi:MAG: tetratricopeptide repeat protein [Bacteroidota bacterium]